jgi:hypothetical protein
MNAMGRIAAFAAAAFPVFARAADQTEPVQVYVENIGVSGVWVLANFSYAGMRAQNSASSGWRIVAFIFGLPGTLITFFAVKEGSYRAYGVDIPRRTP